ELVYFIQIAQKKHISRAAEILAVTQPTLSHSLRKMEESLGVQLLIRSKRGVTLTAAGERFYEQAINMVEKWESIQEAVTNEGHLPMGTIKMGCHTGVAQYTLPKILPNFCQKYPQINFQITHGLSRHLVEKVINDELEFAFAVNPVGHPDLILKLILQDKVALWRHHKCKNIKTLIYDPNLIQSQKILAQLYKKDIHFSNSIKTSSLELMVHLLLEGAGQAIVPERVLKSFSNKNIVHSETSAFYIDKLYAVYKPQFKLSMRAKVFLAYIHKKTWN
ncbi:MAG: LysR family transcriptional regulator, partial [Bdellovibrionales bacterium]|nr:LysR family transcriptional regulator [Bdellovibrionales bacterium]